MTRRVQFTLTPRQVRRLQKAMTSAPQPEARRRAQAIYQLHRGQSPDAVAEGMGVAVSTVRRWHRCWRQKGMRGLDNRKRSGRPTKVTRAYLRLLEKVARTDPRMWGLGFERWTQQRLRRYLAAQTGIQLSESSFRALFSTPRLAPLKPKRAESMVKQLQYARKVMKARLDWLEEHGATYPKRVR